jgi:hypothetical protein
MSNDKKSYKIILPPEILKSEIISMRAWGDDPQTIINKLTKDLGSYREQEIEAYKDEIIERIEKMPNHKLIELVINNGIYKQYENDRYFLFDDTSKTTRPIAKSSLDVFLNPKYTRDNCKVVSEEYNPRSNKAFRESEEGNMFNIYTPALWYFNEFYELSKLKAKPIPAIYIDFFTHLFDADKESYEYVMKWIANSLVSRNYTYLFTVGEGGAGKGILGQILSKLHGPKNYMSQLGALYFTTRFNASLGTKTMFYLDEATLKNSQDEEKFKMLVNEHLEVESKGVDSKIVPNYLNVMLSSNEITGFKNAATERRYSIVTLTKKKLLEHWGADFDINIKALLLDENIADLGAYLLREVLPTCGNMKESFKSSSKIAAMRNESLKDHEEYFLFSFAKKVAGQKLKVADINERLNNELNTNKVNFTRRSLIDLKNRYPGIFLTASSTNEDGSQGPMVFKFLPASMQTSRQSFQFETLDEE